jgi:hypothetical protein
MFVTGGKLRKLKRIKVFQEIKIANQYVENV